MRIFSSILFLVGNLIYCGTAMSASTSGHAIGVNLGIVNSSQPQINELIKQANRREGGISTSELNSAYEVSGFYMYRFSGAMYALQFRPSYFYQTEDGSNSGGANFEYSIQGFTVFPLFRLYPLESDIMKFYMQIGLGYGQMSGTIQEESTTAGDPAKVEFSSGAFGTMVGLGAEFCFNANHCLNVEGNYRYLTFQSSTVDKSSGVFESGDGSLSQSDKGRELEVDGADLAARMGGIMFMAGYTLWF